MDANTINKLESAVVGSRVWLDGESQPYKVRARDDRYIICTKPFNLKRTVLYTIIDLERSKRGPDNMVFGAGYETDEQVSARMAELSAGREEGAVDRLELSRRREVDLDVVMVSNP